MKDAILQKPVSQQIGSSTGRTVPNITSTATNSRQCRLHSVVTQLRQGALLPVKDVVPQTSVPQQIGSSTGRTAPNIASTMTNTCQHRLHSGATQYNDACNDGTYSVKRPTRDTHMHAYKYTPSHRVPFVANRRFRRNIFPSPYIQNIVENVKIFDSNGKLLVDRRSYIDPQTGDLITGTNNLDKCVYTLQIQRLPR